MLNSSPHFTTNFWAVFSPTSFSCSSIADKHLPTAKSISETSFVISFKTHQNHFHKDTISVKIPNPGGGGIVQGRFSKRPDFLPFVCALPLPDLSRVPPRLVGSCAGDTEATRSAVVYLWFVANLSLSLFACRVN